MLLAGDIGGTKTVLALFSAETQFTPLNRKKFISADYDSLEDIVAEYLHKQNANVQAAAFGVAGPVVSNRSNVTNLSWTVDGNALAERCDIPQVILLNDLVATANAVPILPEKDVHILNEGHAIAKGAIAVIAPGTGLGEAFLTWDGNRYVAHASEGGHSSFSPSNQLELELLEFLFPKFGGHVSTERVCSGMGIPNIYDFYHSRGLAEEPAHLTQQLAEADDRTPVISADAMSKTPSPLAKQTLETFAQILAAEMADLALTFLATGGVYLGGGIPPRILPYLESAAFLKTFCAKGRFSNMMKQIPVRVILNSKAALLGAARAGFQLIEDSPQIS